MTAATRIDDLDADATLRQAARVLTERRACEVEDLRLVAHWADLHGHLHTHDDGHRGERRDQGVDGRGRRVKGAEQLVQVGGDGTPAVAEFAIAELACLREVHPASCRAATADVLDLQHRLPHTWAVVTSLRCEAWVARKVAVMTRDLDRFAVGLVDQAVAACIGTESPSRVLTVAEAKTIEADTPAHRRKIEEQRRRRYVALSRTDEHGLRHLIARIHTADAIWIDAMLNRVADLIADRHPDATRDELRSHALGWLARPAELIQLLLTGTQTDTDRDNQDGEQQADQGPFGEQRVDKESGVRQDSADQDGAYQDGGSATEPAAGPDEGDPAKAAGTQPAAQPEAEPVVDQEDPHTGDPVPPPEPPDQTPSRALAFPADLLDTLRQVDPAKLRPRATLYVHLHQAALEGSCAGVARVEESGPVDLTQLHELLKHAHVAVKPVIDLADQISSNAYEIPEAIKEHTHLRTPGDYFPHATAVTRAVDLDHPDPYRPHGPPRQTGTHNTGPLTRRHHRIKTHAGWASRQTGPGHYVWRTPHGHYRLVDHTGTHPLPETLAEGLFDTDPLQQALSRIAIAHHTGTLDLPYKDSTEP